MPILPSVPDAPPLRPLEELSAALWQERQLLDQLAGALGEEVAALRADPARWYPGCESRSGVPERLRAAGLLRAVRVDDVATRVGLPSTSSLAQLAELVPEPWSLILERHRDGLRRAITAVERRLEQVRDLLAGAGRSPSELPSVGLASLADALR